MSPAIIVPRRVHYRADAFGEHCDLKIRQMDYNMFETVYSTYTEINNWVQGQKYSVDLVKVRFDVAGLRRRCEWLMCDSVFPEERKYVVHSSPTEAPVDVVWLGSHVPAIPQAPKCRRDDALHCYSKPIRCVLIVPLP